MTVTLLNRFSRFEGVIGLLYGGILFLYSVVALEGKRTDFLIISLMWVIIALVSSYIMFTFLGIATGEGIGALLKNSGDLRTYSALAAAALKFSLGRIILAVYKRRNKIAVQLEDWTMAGMFFLLFVLALGMFRMESEELSQMERYSLSLQIMGVMFAITVILNMFYRILDKYRKEKLEREYLDEEQHLQAEQLNELYKIGRQANHMKHDMKMKLDTISRILEKGEYKEAELCIKRLGSEWENCLEVPTDTGNEGLNAALMKAMQRCKERDLRQKEAQYQQKLSSTYLDYKDKLLTVQEYFMLKNKYQAALAELEVARKEKELLLNKMQETYGEDLELSHAAEKYFGQMVVTKDMVDALIERIEVFAKGRIHIIFRFEDEYRSLLEKRADMEQEGAN